MSVYYSVLVADTLTDEVVAEAPIAVREYTRVLNDMATCAGSLFVPAIKTYGVDAVEATLPVRRAIYLLREGTPVWGGLITGAEYDSESDRVEINASDWFWVLDRRNILPDPASAPPDNVAERVVAFTDDDQNDIARELIRLGQLGTNRDLLLVPDDNLSFIPRDRTYYGYELRKVGVALRQLANVINGPDIRFDVAHSNDQSTPVRAVRLGDPYLGAEGDAHDWEYRSANTRDYRYPLDPSEHCDRFYAIGDGESIGTPIVMRDRAADLGEDLAGWPGLDADEQYSGVDDPDTLAGHALDQLARRSGYRIVMDVKINGGATPKISEYAPGDYARFVADGNYHSLDTTTRIVADRVSINDETGDEDVDLVVAPIVSDPEGGA